MCHILIKCTTELKDRERKEFQQKAMLEIRKVKRNPVVIFVFGYTRKAKKIERNYLKKHPRADIRTFEPTMVALAS